MPSKAGKHFDFFLSRRGSIAAVACEVYDALTAQGYAVFVQDYDIRLGDSFIEAMHEAIKSSRDLVILFTRDYETSAYTRKEFTSFEAQRLQDQQRRIVILRCEDAPLSGLLADNVYQDLVGITDPEERRHRIIAAAEGHSQAVKPPPRPFIGLPPRDPGFTGRAEALDQLDAILVQDKPAVVTQAVGRAAVRGLGGVGKTSLAVEYAYRFRGLYAGVCWCPSESRQRLLTSLAALAVALGAVAAEEADIEKAARAALRRLTAQRGTWLLIYDNVTSPQEIADLLPTVGARVLITSRFSDWAEWADEVALDVLPLKEAVSFLQRRAGQDDAAGATVLAEALGRLPLALDHAAAFCRTRHLRFADYAAQASSRIAASPPRSAAYPRSVAATFDLAITAAVAQCASAEGLMAYFAQCAPERIPMTLVEGAIEDESVRLDAVAALTEMSLVKHDKFDDGTDAATVHRLVQAVARVRSEANGTAHDAAARLITRLEAVYPRDGFKNPASWARCAHYTPHLLAICATEAADGAAAEKCGYLLDRAGSYFYGRGVYPAARPLSERALAIIDKVLGPEHPLTATSLNNLAGLLQAQGDLATARPLRERALAIWEKVLGPEHPNTATGLNNLANLLKDQGDLSGARPLFERALAIREKVLGPEHSDTATSLNNLANLLRDQGDLAGARPLFERALAIWEKVLGPEHPNTASGLNSLAFLLQDQGDLAGARLLFERALAINEKLLGPEHPLTAHTLNNLATVLQGRGDLAGARPLFVRALAIWEKALGPEHPNTATSLNNLANLLQDQGDLSGARPLFERALAIREKVFGPEHPVAARSLNNLAAVLWDQGDLVGARPLFERALAINEKVLGPQHPATNRARSNFARLLLVSGSANQALQIGEIAAAAHYKVLGRDHAWTRDSASVTADALDALGRSTEAATLREKYGITAKAKK